MHCSWQLVQGWSPSSCQHSRLATLRVQQRVAASHRSWRQERGRGGRVETCRRGWAGGRWGERGHAAPSLGRRLCAQTLALLRHRWSLSGRPCTASLGLRTFLGRDGCPRLAVPPWFARHAALCALCILVSSLPPSPQLVTFQAGTAGSAPLIKLRQLLEAATLQASAFRGQGHGRHVLGWDAKEAACQVWPGTGCGWQCTTVHGSVLWGG